MSSDANEALSLSNLLRPETRANPYPFYAQLRSQDPVHWDPALGFWVLTRYRDVASAYHDERFSRAQGLSRGFQRLPEEEQRIAQPVYQAFSQSMPYCRPAVPHALTRAGEQSIYAARGGTNAPAYSADGG